MELRNFFKKNNSKNSAQNEQDFYQKNTQKKFLKIFAAASLALITCATTLLATTPFGSGTASAAAESEMTAQENLAAGTLNLNPDTDPVIYTTSSGLEIKFHNWLANGQISSGGLTGFPYLTMASRNWIIIGRHSGLFSNCNGQGVVEGSNTIFETLDDSAAGRAIWFEEVWNNNIVSNDAELSTGQVLVISENYLVHSSMNASQGDYNGSGIDGSLNALYDTLGFTDAEKEMIVPQTFTNKSYDDGISITSTSVNQKIFPLAFRGEKFTVTTYLNQSQRVFSQIWGLRSGDTDNGGYSYNIVYKDGQIGSVYGYNAYYWRGAMVLQLV